MPESTLYNSPYLADHYALTFDHQPHLQDIAVYRQIFRSLPSSNSIWLDIGTGSGRVPLSLLEENSSSQNVHFIATDNSPSMLHVAAKNAARLSRGLLPVTWELGDALRLTGLKALKLSAKVDVLTFAYGSIVHLTGEDDLKIFFDQVARVLRPQTGRAYITIYDTFLRDGEMSSMVEGAEEEEMETKSLEFPGVVYRKRVLGEYLGDCTASETVSVEVGRKVGELGWERIEEHLIRLELRRYSLEDIQQTAEGAGLTLLETKRFGKENFLVFSLLDGAREVA